MCLIANISISMCLIQFCDFFIALNWPFPIKATVINLNLPIFSTICRDYRREVIKTFKGDRRKSGYIRHICSPTQNLLLLAFKLVSCELTRLHRMWGYRKVPRSRSVWLLARKHRGYEGRSWTVEPWAPCWPNRCATYSRGNACCFSVSFGERSWKKMCLV